MSTLLEVLAGVRSKLTPIAPTFIRDAVPRGGDGLPSLPERCIIIDLIIDTKVRDFTDVYATVLVQVGCWSTSIAQSLTDLEAVRVALEAGHAWDMVRINGTQSDGQYRGVTADFTTLY